MNPRRTYPQRLKRPTKTPATLYTAMTVAYTFVTWAYFYEGETGFAWGWTAVTTVWALMSIGLWIDYRRRRHDWLIKLTASKRSPVDYWEL